LLSNEKYNPINTLQKNQDTSMADRLDRHDVACIVGSQHFLSRMSRIGRTGAAHQALAPFIQFALRRQ
jgi:hypothetical protein